MSTDTNLNAVLLAGIARSGTTWISNILNYDNRYRSLFEPFHPQHGIELRKQVKNGMYLRPDTENEALKQGFIDLLSGNMINDYVDQDNKGDYGERILVKSIRVNTMLPWLHANLPELPIVYITRHPASVITSHLRLGWSASKRNVERMLSQPELLEDYLAPYADLMKTAENDFDNLLYFWCANNYMMRRHFQNNEIYTVYYETLKRQPIDEARKIFAFLGQPLHEDALAKIVEKPSRTTWRKASEKHHWTEIITLEQQAKLWKTLEVFGLDDIYNEANAPRIQKPSFVYRVKSKIRRMTRSVGRSNK